MESIEIEVNGKRLSIERGKMATQADGFCSVRYGDTVVLVTSVMQQEIKEDIDFFPLTVEYQERAYAAGKIPGGFIKREGRPQDKEILCGRLVDRSLRPLFPAYLRREVQIIATVLSCDRVNPPDVLAIIGASCALSMSSIPFLGPVVGVRIGKIGPQFIINPSFQQMDESTLDLVVAGTEKEIVMLEGGGKEVQEEEILEGIEVAHREIKRIIPFLKAFENREKIEVSHTVVAPDAEQEIREFALPDLEKANEFKEKKEREAAISQVVNRALERFSPPYEERDIKTTIEKAEKDTIRSKILREGKRIDGRKLDEIRGISCEVATLPCTHGSGLFTRGGTQALAVATLGTSTDEQIVDDIAGRTSKRFMLHYNFPPFSTGEVRPMRGPGRREIGHGALAERALLPVIPKELDFPYTIRIVSDILESNGSTSMASVCGGTLALMDAGVPISQAVAGVAMGLVKDGEDIAILSDITGLEDRVGDMDFKVAGTRVGITSIQMDIKTTGIDTEIMQRALQQAKQGRMFILDEMAKAISTPRPKISSLAPRILTTFIPTTKIKDVIGPSGKTIRNIIDTTGVKIDIDDDGKILIASSDEEAATQALEMINYLTAEVEVGKVYLGKVRGITKFGAFVEILPGKEGLVHISQLADHHVKRVEDILNEGEKVLVKVTSIDEQGRINLSRKQALYEKGPLNRK